jgi:tetratricopeptide (TPR) repeat protein
MDTPKDSGPQVDALRADLARAQGPAERLAALMALADGLRNTMPFDAEPFLLEALDLARELQDRASEAAAEARLSEIAARMGDRAAAMAHAERALAVARAAACRREQALALSLLGIHYSEVADYARARQCYEECRDVSHEIGHVVGVQSSLNQLGNLAMLQGNREEALGYYQQQVDVNEQVGDDLGRAALHTNIGMLLMEMGRWEDAVENLYRALGICERRGYQDVRHAALNILGELFLKRDKVDRAVDTLEVVTEAGRRRAASPAVFRDALSNLGQAYLRRGEAARAGKLYGDAMRLCEESEDRREQVILCWRMAELALALGQTDRAGKFVDDALRTAQELQLRPQQAEVLRVQALLRAATGDPDGAIDSFESALDALAGSEESFELARLQLQYGRFLVAQGDRTGVDQLKAAAKVFRRLAVVAEAEEVSRLIFRQEMKADRDMALLQAVSGLSALALAPRQFLEQTLSLLCEGLSFDRGALLMNGRPVVAQGRVNAAAGLELAARGELVGTPAALCFPLRARGRVMGSIYLERSGTGPVNYNTVVIDTLANLLTVTVQRLGDSLARAAESGQMVPGLEFRGYVGTSLAIREVLARLADLAQSDVPVLLTGEHGTGKMLLARVVHESGPRVDGGFAVVNCTEVPEQQLSAELFGSGAAPGGASTGRLAAAAGGTVYFEEIGHLSLALQSKLLRVMEWQCGGGGQSGVRVVAGTSRNLPSLVQQGFFSAELCRRLSATELRLPALRERRDDIPGLVRYLINESNQEFGRQVLDAQPEVVNWLLGYAWPGNLSELQNVIERAVLLAAEPVLKLTDLPSGFARTETPDRPQSGTNAGAV